MKRHHAIRLNLWLPVLILGAFIAMMLASSIWRYGQQTAQLETRATQLVQGRMANMQHRLESLLRLHQDALVAEEIAEFGAMPEADFLALIDDNGQILYSTHRPALGNPIANWVSGFDASLFGKAQQNRLLTLQFDAPHDHIMAYQPISLATLPGQIRPTRTGVLLLKYHLAAEKAAIWQEALNRSISDIIIGSVTMLLLMFVMHRWLTVPLGYLRSVVNRISRGDFNTHVEITGRGELADLGAAINKMQTDLAQSTQQLQTSYEELRASEENLAVTLSSIGDAVITTDITGNVVQLNPVAEQLTGWPLADASGQPLATVFHIINSQTRLPAANPVHRVLETGHIVGLANHTSLIARDGSEYHIADSAAPIRDKHGHTTGVVLVFHDVSEQYRQQAIIADQEAELRKITNNLPGPVSRVNRDGRYIFVSDVYESWFGKRPADVIGKTQIETIGPDLYAQYEPYFKRALSGEAVSFEVALPDPVNGLRYALVNVVPDFDNDGKACGYFTIGTDISQRKLAEREALALRDQLLQATKMEAVGHLTSGIAHDFNNMLGAILGYAELSQHVIATGKPQAIDTYLVAISNAGNRAKELIAQMLTFSRKSAIATEDVPVILLEPVVKEVITLLSSSIPSSIELNYRITAENIKSRIQPVHLHQIIVNLGINARDAMGEYGKIDITLSSYHSHGAICDSCKHPITGDYAQISVIDSGSGIDTQLLGKIFDPFFTTKGVGMGTGMGLSVVHGLVHSLGGHIRLETGATGTAISILLPLENSQLEEVHATAFSLPRPQDLLRGAHIMVVDDETTMATMLRELLSMHGAQVTVFNAPLEAMASFENNPQIIDLVITDETMPGLSGMHLAEQMLKIKPALPIILCTGYSERATAESTASIGIAGFFSKPVKMNELLQKVQQVLKTNK